MNFSRNIALTLAFTALLAFTRGADAQNAAPQWTGAWAASPSGNAGALTYQGFTVRQTIHPGANGTQYAIRLSNDASPAPITVGSVLASMNGTSRGSINTYVSLPVLFGGHGTVTIPAYGSVLSDPVPGVVAAQTDFTISLYVVASTTGPTIHMSGQSTGFVAAGNQASSATLTNAVPITQRVILSGVDVLQSAGAGTIVTLGDSITDGYQSTVDANHRWPDYLMGRLQSNASLSKLGVVDAGISSDQLLLDIPLNGDGVLSSALSRLTRDVLAVPNLRYVTVLLGINDIFQTMNSPQPVTANAIIQGYQQIIAKAHEVNAKVLIGTITPVYPSIVFTAANEAIRTQVNAWIRAGAGFDGVLDFDAALRDPVTPIQMISTFDSGDHVHPNDAGYAAMAKSINLTLFAQ